MDIEAWKKRNATPKYYAHFDKRVSVHEAWPYISNPIRVAHHGFYPFIHYQQKFNKYSKEEGVKPKERELCYAAHIDRYIYSYYGFLLNEKYISRVIKDGISDSAVAYRTDLGCNNIHFAKRAFDFIRDNSPCFIVVGDFTHFFDKLNHRYLKRQLCNLLETKVLAPDFYAVFKNITRFATWNLEDLLQINKFENTRQGVRTLNQRPQVLTPDQFKLLKKDYINPHAEPFGIPQGSPISAILSNIYMLDFDKKLRQFTDENSGLYMRYSDDFIVILPGRDSQSFSQQLKWIQTLVQDTDGLELQEEKTQAFSYSPLELQNVNADYFELAVQGKSFLNYLGFTFDGKTVTIRDKTLSKYHYRMYRKAKFIVKSKGYTKFGSRISKKNLYNLYTVKGANKGNGNFITYVQRAEDVFGNGEAIARGTKNHLGKIKRVLNTPQSL